MGIVGLVIVGVEVTEEQGGKSGTIHVIMKLERHQQELMFSLIQIQMVTYRNVYTKSDN